MRIDVADPYLGRTEGPGGLYADQSDRPRTSDEHPRTGTDLATPARPDADGQGFEECRRDTHQDLVPLRLRDRPLLDADVPDPAQDADSHGPADRGNAHFTAPSDRPCTSLSCAANPAMSTGSETTIDAAHTLARNRPWL